MINDKKESFSQMRDAFLWIKENTPEDAVILGEGVHLYTIYYAERTTKSWPNKYAYAEFYSYLVPKSWVEQESTLEGYEIEADYIVADAFHLNQPYVNNW